MNVKHAFTTAGFVKVPYPQELAEAVSTAMASWQAFCRLSQTDKLLFSTNDRVEDYGYMLRQDKGTKVDRKELFHVNLRDLQSLSEISKDFGDAQQFIQSCSRLITCIQPLIFDFVRSVECDYGLVGFERLVKTSVPNWTFRFLHYFGGDTLAHSHTDRGGFTLHLAETSGGGECLGFDAIWRPWPLSGTQTIIFPGMLLQHLSKGLIKALAHRVIGNEASIKQSRFALVAFIDFEHTKRFNDAEHRTQDFAEGSTYSMPFREFDQYFVSR